MEELRQRHAEYVQRHGQAGLKARAALCGDTQHVVWVGRVPWDALASVSYRASCARSQDATSPTKPARPVRDAWAASHAEGEVPTFSDGEEEVLAMEPRGAPGEEEVQVRAAD